MGPRRGKRALGFAALVLAVVAAVFIVLLSRSDLPVVEPINEKAAKPERHEGRIPVEKDPIGKPIPNSPTRPRHIIRRIVKIKRSSPALVPQPRLAPHGRRPARRHRRAHPDKRHGSHKRSGRHNGAPVTPSAAPSVPAPSPPPAASVPAPAPPAQPAPAPNVLPVEIQIEDGDLTSGFNFVVYSRGERVRLHVSSDRNVVVQIPGYGISQPVAAGGGALIEFDATSTGLYEVKLQGRKLSLALIRVRD